MIRPCHLTPVSGVVYRDGISNLPCKPAMAVKTELETAGAIAIVAWLSTALDVKQRRKPDCQTVRLATVRVVEGVASIRTISNSIGKVLRPDTLRKLCKSGTYKKKLQKRQRRNSAPSTSARARFRVHTSPRSLDIGLLTHVPH